MGSVWVLAGVVWLLAGPSFSQPTTGIITTVAGMTATRGFDGDDGPAVQSTVALANLQNECDPNRFEQTSHISVDAKGNVYFADSQNQRIRRIDPSGNITTVAGSGERPAINARCEPTGPPVDGDNARNARLFNPADVVVAPNGNLILADQQNNRIRQVTPAGAISTIAGSGLHNFFAPGIPATSSPLDWPGSLAIGPGGTVYFAELHSNRVGRIGGDGRLATVAGTGFPGFNGDQISAIVANLRKPAGIAFDTAGNLLIADTGNHRVRRVAANGVISTLAGNGSQSYCGDGERAERACLDTPMDVKADALGNIYIADTGNHRIRRVDPSGVITTVAGTGAPDRGADGVMATSSALNFPVAVAVDAANDLYIVDWQNYLIRKVSFTSVVNAATFTQPVSPGSLISILGSNLAAESAVAEGAPWPLELGGLSVNVNGSPIPLYSVSPGQINAQLPFDLEPGVAVVVLASAHREFAPLTVPVVDAAVGLFTNAGTDRAITIRVGRTVALFLTGIGAVSPKVSAGQAAPLDALSIAVAPVTATVGGLNAEVLFAGLVPGLVALAEAVIILPEGVTPGDDVPVSIEIGGRKSKVATISIPPGGQP